jgi:hypothetical protein|tara:strand:+ start:3681 stop:3950 length:270 start_codon:yes stop_codon:yes gene_type:complete
MTDEEMQIKLGELGVKNNVNEFISGYDKITSLADKRIVPVHEIAGMLVAVLVLMRDFNPDPEVMRAAATCAADLAQQLYADDAAQQYLN